MRWKSGSTNSECIKKIWLFPNTLFFFFQAEDGIRDVAVTGVQTLLFRSTENVSSGGMRVQTDRPWKPDTRLLVETSESERSARARVIYCETLSNTTFAVGLEFSE